MHYIYVEYTDGTVAHSSGFKSYREACEIMVLYMSERNPVHKNFWIESE